MSKFKSQTSYYLYCAIVFIAIIFYYGSIPFFSIPTLGQAVWTSGFAKSLSHNSNIFDFFARDIGFPNKAAIAFGLSGAWVQSLFIRMGFMTSDAYAMMNIFWILISYLGCLLLVKYFNVPKITQPLMVAVWFSMPIISQHLGYSMLSLGIALIPTYIYSTLTLIKSNIRNYKKFSIIVVAYILLAIISVFMDGYTFVMYGCASSLLISYSIFKKNKPWQFTIIKTSIHFGCFILAYVLYVSFIGKGSYTASSEDYFRSWGLDISFLFIPTIGKSWILDILGYSTSRSERIFFGDPSVWNTTFCLPLILISIYSFVKAKPSPKIALPIFLIAMLAFYMSLGPSIKFESKRTNSIAEKKVPFTDMPQSSALIPSGNAYLSKLPGFNAMRATYRWLSLFLACLWIIFIICASKKNNKTNILLCITIIALNMPDLVKTIESKKYYRKMFSDINNDLINPLQRKVSSGNRVVFLPTSNDFLINYVAPMSNLNSYNIGGDKNLEEAKKHWPMEIRNFNSLDDENKAFYIENMLLKGEVNTVVIPFLDMLWSAHVWPCKALSYEENESMNKNNLIIDDYPNDTQCPANYRKLYAHLIEILTNRQTLTVEHDNLFVTIKLKEKYSSKASRTNYLNNLIGNIRYPIIMNSSNPSSALLMDGMWHNLEKDQVWSGKEFSLKLPVPNKCKNERCEVSINMKAFAANKIQPYTMTIISNTRLGDINQTVSFNDEETKEILIPLNNDKIQSIKFTVPQATSPKKLNLSQDDRILGVAAQKIEIIDDSYRKKENIRIKESLGHLSYPISISLNNPNVKAILLGQWHNIENDHVWSGKRFSLLLPQLPKSCIQECKISIEYNMFNASIEHPAILSFSFYDERGNIISKKLRITDKNNYNLVIPQGKSPFTRIDFHAESAKSPLSLNLSNDSRVLGMALHKINLIN
ncbi:hypothetical protein ABXV16_08175 [Pantoea leporis]|uniref:DUF7024 domain-containing protein n=1 Tax=Pantoea leporis TaxID=2933780 RepID=A0ABV2DXF3_9GAMM